MLRSMGVVCVALAVFGCVEDSDSLAAQSIESVQAPSRLGDLPLPAVLPAPSRVAHAASAQGNVLILLLDDVGTDKISMYGQSPDAPYTPVIDGLADAGVTFERAWAYPTCSPTRAAIMTGLHPYDSGVGNALSPNGNRELADDAWTLPRMLDDGAAEAYAHAALGKWHLTGANAPGTVELDPHDKGWGWFRSTEMHVQDYYSFPKSDNGVPVHVTTYATTDTVDDAIEFIGAQSGPWVTYLAFQAAHAPYQEPPADLVHTVGGTSKVARYHRLIEAVDTEIGRLLRSIRPADLARTTIVVMGDNGTPENAISAGTPPEQCKKRLLEGGVRVPLIVAGPHVRAPGSWSDALVQATDLFATVADVAGAPVDPVLVEDSISLLPYLRDPTLPGARSVQFTEKRKREEGVWTGGRAVSDGTYKLIEYMDGDVLFAEIDATGWEGPNLLDGGPLTAVHADALQRLSASFPVGSAEAW